MFGAAKGQRAAELGITRPLGTRSGTLLADSTLLVFYITFPFSNDSYL